MDFENSCINTNEGRQTHLVSVAELFSMHSSFWRNKLHADIHGGSPNFCENFHETYMKHETYVYLSAYVVLIFLQNTKNSFIMAWVIPD